MKNYIIFAWICTCFTIYGQDVKKATVVNLRGMAEKQPFDMGLIYARLEQIEAFKQLEEKTEDEDYKQQETDSLRYNLPTNSQESVAKLTSLYDSPAPYFDFDAISSNSSNPPDINAAIGEDFNGKKYLVSVSQGGIMKITDENNEAILTDANGNPMPLIDYFPIFSSVANSLLDPQLEFDNIEKRWIMSVIGDYWVNTDTEKPSLLFAVSKTSDPTGDWYVYKIDIDPLCDEGADPSTNDCVTFLYDQPWIGYNTDFVVLTFESTEEVPGSPAGVQMQSATRVVVIPDKYSLYHGSFSTNLTFLSQYNIVVLQGINSGSTNSFINAPNIFPYLSGRHFHPCINEDTNPTLGAEMYFIRPESVQFLPGANYICSKLEIKKMELQNGAISIIDMPSVSSSFKWRSEQNVITPPAPQLGGNNIAINTWKTVHNVLYKNGCLWTVQNLINSDNALNIERSCLLYWQIRVDGPNYVTNLEQCGIIDDDLSKNTALLMPSIAVNDYNDVLVGYSLFREDIYPSAAYSVRKHDDPLNEMRKPYIYQYGTTAYPSPYWGDYSASFTDVNGKDFWTIQEYSAPTAMGAWNTRLALVGLDAICDPSYTLTNTEYKTIHKYESGDYITSKSKIMGNSHILYDAENYIRLLPGGQGFHVQKGSTLHAYINGCGNTKQKQYEYFGDTANAIICYPNPSSDVLNFDFWEKVEDEVSLKIFNANGLEVLKLNLTSEEESISVSVAKWISGIYFWEILYKNKVYTGKFIKS